jgi:hypothetical protein
VRAISEEEHKMNRSEVVAALAMAAAFLAGAYGAAADSSGEDVQAPVARTTVHIEEHSAIQLFSRMARISFWPV